MKNLAEKRQKQRKEHNIYKTKEHPENPKYYILDMFPYPSGAGLHVGHPKGYVASDTIARKKLLEGFNVLHPMGFDTFGLGTEQYAIEHKMKPQIVAQKNIATYIKQLENIGFTYDWGRSFSTADAEYFKRTQQIFLKFYTHYYDENEKKAKPISELEERLKKEKKSESEIKKILDSQRLAYLDYKPINRCPNCKTGLANEDLEDGKCERCRSEVEQKPMRQRVLRITKYAERLLEGLDTLDWEHSMKELERNWIGKSEGSEFQMKISPLNKGGRGDSLSFSVYTTRLDTVFGMSFVVMAPEHPLVEKITTADHKEAVRNYQEQAKHKTQLERSELQKEKTGVFTGAYAINPFNNEEVPIYIGDYVLANYGTGVVMAVPAHDERDFEFAKKYGLDIVQSVKPHPSPLLKGEGSVESNKGKEYYPSSPLKGGGNSEGNKGEYYHFYEDVPAYIKELAKDLRKKQTPSEIILWEALRDRKLFGWKFRRQHPFGRYIADFYSDELKLIIEVDGKVHEYQKEYDQEREAVLKTYGLTVIRFKNEEVSTHLEKVLEDIAQYVKELTPLAFEERGWGGGVLTQVYPDKGILVNSGQFSGLQSDEAIEKMQIWLQEKGIGGKKVNYKIQDWVFSRQRYRGEPFPIVFCEDCGTVPLQESDLPLLLPDIENYEPTGTEEGPLAEVKERIKTPCPLCGKPARRESNTMPGWAGSSRYWLRYMDPHNNEAFVSPEKEQYRKNVDVYIGGAEHVTRHMIYARFWQKFLFDLGLVSQDEPFKKYQKVGLIMAEDGRKMSKRRGNVVNPDDIIAEYGADVFRTYEMFMGPFDQFIARNTNGIKGVKKFLDKVIALYDKIDPALEQESGKNLSMLHQTIKKLNEEIDEFKFNTSLAQLMILVNTLGETENITRETFETLILLVAPFAPHLAEEFWHQLGNQFSIFTTGKRPKYDEKYLVSEEITLAVQFNGKMRGTLQLAASATEEQALEALKRDEKLNTYLVGDPKKIIFIPGKIINIVL